MALRRCVRSTRHAVLVCRRFEPRSGASNPIDSFGLLIHENGTEGIAPMDIDAGPSAPNTKRMEESCPRAARVVLLQMKETMRRRCQEPRRMRCDGKARLDEQAVLWNEMDGSGHVACSSK